MIHSATLDPTDQGESAHGTRYPGVWKDQRGTTHVNFGFAYDGYAILIPHFFASCERDVEMCEHRALRWRKEMICDKSNGFNGSVSRQVVAHG